MVFNGLFILKTTNARFVWEQPFYPQFYVPKSELLENSKQLSRLEIHEGDAFRSDDGVTVGTQWTIRVGDKSTDRVVAFSDELTGNAAQLKGLVKVDFASMDQW